MHLLSRQEVITQLPVFTLSMIEATVISCYSDYIIITLNFHSASVSCNNNDIILVIGYN